MLCQQRTGNQEPHSRQQTPLERMFKVTEDDFISEVTALVSSIRDPEYSQTLDQLSIINKASVTVEYLHLSQLTPSSPAGCPMHHLLIKPTVPHCHLTQQIGLSIRLKLKQELPHQWLRRMKIRIKIQAGSHHQRDDMEKLINDRERVTAAMENQEVMCFIANLIK